VGDIQQELLPHPLSPLLTSLGMAGGTEPACLAGKHKQPLFPTVGTPDAGKPAHRITTIEVLLDNILDYRTEVPVLLLKTILVFTKEALKIIKEHPVKKSNRAPSSLRKPYGLLRRSQKDCRKHTKKESYLEKNRHFFDPAFFDIFHQSVVRIVIHVIRRESHRLIPL